MAGLEGEGAQDEEVEGALEELGAARRHGVVLHPISIFDIGVRRQGSGNAVAGQER
jgi:hypothetical protein